MSEPTVPGFLFDSVRLSIFDKIVLRGGGGQAVGGVPMADSKAGVTVCVWRGKVWRESRKEGKPALVLSADVPKFWSHLVAEMRRNRGERGGTN